MPIPADPPGSHHVPVLLDETLTGLALRPNSRVIDGTLGGGGHAAAILAQLGPAGKMLGLDADPAAVQRVQQRLAEAVANGRLRVAQANFEQMREVAEAHDFSPVDGILLDLGTSSFQLETAARGFSFQQDGPLDMRFDLSEGPSAAELVNTLPEAELADVIYRYGEERRSRRIAREIVAARTQRPVETTAQLAELVERAVGGRRGARLHPATRTFQALRIAVNRELEQLERTLPQTLDLLADGGRLAVISFHSLEDRIVKQWMQSEARESVPDPGSLYGHRERTPTLRLLARKPIAPGEAEQRENPRSRSAKLRLAERINRSS